MFRLAYKFVRFFLSILILLKKSQSKSDSLNYSLKAIDLIATEKFRTDPKRSFEDFGP